MITAHFRKPKVEEENGRALVFVTQWSVESVVVFAVQQSASCLCFVACVLFAVGFFPLSLGIYGNYQSCLFKLNIIKHYCRTRKIVLYRYSIFLSFHFTT